MLNDELIGAYLDGELDSEKRMLVEHWLASDQGAAARLERMRGADAMARRILPRVATPKDDPLVAMILAPMAEPVRPRPRIWAQRIAAMAAACLLGVLVGRATLGGGATPLSLSSQIAHLLDTQPSGQSAAIAGGAFEVALSVRTEAGQVCRHYRTTTGAAAADALACKVDGEWRVVAQALAPSISEEAFILAGAGSPIDAALAGLGVAAALDSDEESALIERGWER